LPTWFLMPAARGVLHARAPSLAGHAAKPSAAPGCGHEIKQNGYADRAQGGNTVRLFIRRLGGTLVLGLRRS
jgi:hypothetical protein